ncbi:MAG: chromate efflux transporter [Deltaproteobacteria bacterium]|nr:MAG: chromate efflux transporter [Deltaproteobacteria bacterium]
MSKSSYLKEIGLLFLKLGIIAFGGPAAHIAMMQDEVVRRRKWMTDEHFLDMVGATSLIPGPNSTEMAIHCGYHRGGLRGLVVAGLCFLLPATLLTGGLAWLYVRYQHVPQLNAFFFGIKPAVLTVILAALYKLGKKALKGWQLGVIGALAVAAVLLGLSEILTILAGGAIGLVWLGLPKRSSSNHNVQSSWLATLLAGSSGVGPLWLASATASKATLSHLFLVFLKVGSVLFGSGYVLVAYLDGELVQTLGWLTKPQLLDAIAIGQFTPGPVLSTATFVGFQIHGVWGAMLATLGIFLPSFFFVAMLNPLIPKLRQSTLASAFLDAVNVSAVGLMVAVVYKFGTHLFLDWKSIVIFAVSTLVLFGSRQKVSSVWIVLGGALCGFGLSLL